MPLPIGHALAGVVLQQVRPGFFFTNRWRDALFFMLLANLPDADFLPGLLCGRPNLYHHGAFHSLGAALGVAALGAGFFCLKKRPVAAGRCGPVAAGRCGPVAAGRCGPVAAGRCGPVAAGRYGRFWGPAAMIFLLFCSHLLLDLFALDLVAPFGLPLFWPFSGRYFIASRPFFINITRSSASGDFFPSLFNGHNLAAALREVVILGSLALAAAWLRARAEKRSRGRGEKGGISGG